PDRRAGYGHGAGYGDGSGCEAFVRCIHASFAARFCSVTAVFMSRIDFPIWYASGSVVAEGGTPQRPSFTDLLGSSLMKMPSLFCEDETITRPRHGGASARPVAPRRASPCGL